jgi:hypothetical protein
MPTESLREGEAMNYLRFRDTLAESDSNAIIKTGENTFRTLPVLIEAGGEKLYVEISFRFYDPEQLPGFQRFELRLDEREKIEAEKAAAEAEAQKLAQPKTFTELLLQNQKNARQNMAALYASRKSQNSMPAPHALAAAGRALAQQIASNKSQRKLS